MYVCVYVCGIPFNTICRDTAAIAEKQLKKGNPTSATIPIPIHHEQTLS